MKNLPPPAGILVRLSSLAYELLLLLALELVMGFAFFALAGGTPEGGVRLIYQLWIAAVAGVYFVWHWTHGGQTVAMKAWRLRLTDRGGRPLAARRAVVRYLLALALLLPGTALSLALHDYRWLLLSGSGFLWALVDRERLFLHDRLSGSVVRREPRSAPLGARQHHHRPGQHQQRGQEGG